MNSSEVTPEQATAYNETLLFEYYLGIVIPTLYAGFILVGLAGNVLVLTVLGLNASMRNSTNTLVLNLALSDVMFLTACVPFTAADYALSYWPWADWWCGALNYLQFVAAYASVWTLVLMAGDRFLAVVFPVQSLGLRSARNTAALVFLLWLLIVAVCSPILFQYSIVHYRYFGEHRSTCSYLKEQTRMGSPLEIKGFYMSFNVFGYVLPLGIASGLYCIFLRKLWSMSKPGNASARRGARQESIRAKRKVTWMVSGVIVTFAICWLPINICFFINAFNYPIPWFNTRERVTFQIFSQVLAYANSCMNPILYAFLSDNFRRGFLRIVCISCGFRRKNIPGKGCCGSSRLGPEAGSFFQTTVPSGTGTGTRMSGQMSTSLIAGRSPTIHSSRLSATRFSSSPNGLLNNVRRKNSAGGESGRVGLSLSLERLRKRSYGSAVNSPAHRFGRAPVHAPLRGLTVERAATPDSDEDVEINV